MTRKRRGGTKKGESTLASNQFCLCSPYPGTPREVYRVSQRRGRKEIEVTRRRGRGVKRRETDLASNQFPKCSPQPRISRNSQYWVEKRGGGRR